MNARVIPPIAITSSILTSSTVIETTPAAYAGGTTYAAGDLVYVGTVGQLLTVYQSLQSANTGHTPSSSPTWWANVGTLYAEYNAGTTYAIGNIVQQASSHQVYEALAAGSGNALSNTTKWLLLGPTNKWAMFDTLRSTSTSAPLSMTIVLTPGMRINACALTNVVADSVMLSATSVVGGGVVYAHTETLSTREVFDWYSYFFEPFTSRKSVVVFDIPPYSDLILTVTLTIASGDVSIGSVDIGSSVDLGPVLVGASPDKLNFSTITRAVDGTATIVSRPSKPNLTVQTWFDYSMLKKVMQVAEYLDAVPAVWVGLEDSADYRFDSMIIRGIYRKFTPTYAEGNRVDLNMELEEI